MGIADAHRTVSHQSEREREREREREARVGSTFAVMAALLSVHLSSHGGVFHVALRSRELKVKQRGLKVPEQRELKF